MQIQLRSNLLVNDVVAKSRSSSLHLGNEGRDLLDAIHLLIKEVLLKEVTQVSISIGSLVHVQKALIDLENIIYMQWSLSFLR